MVLIELEVYKVFIKIKCVNSAMIPILDSVLQKYTTYTYLFNRRARRYVREPDKGFFAVDREENTYRFAHGAAKDVLLQLYANGCKQEHIKVIDKRDIKRLDYKIKEIEVDWNKEFVLRDYQVEGRDRIIGNKEKNYPGMDITLIVANTGIGKSLLGSAVIHSLKYCTALIILPRYLDKWLEDLEKYCLVKKEDIYIVQGNRSIRELSLSDKESLYYKFYIFSVPTMTNYIKDYENKTLDPSCLPPTELYKHLGIGLLFNDETHQFFHAVYKACLYYPGPKLLGMTATPETSNKQTNKIIPSLFPNNTVINDLVTVVPYINVKAVSYELLNGRGIPTNSTKGYSHTLYEQFICRHSLFLRSYTDMINHYVKESFVKYFKKGNKCIIFCSTVIFCKILANTLTEYYPNLNIGTYTQEDEYDNILNNDISVTTLGSSSTGLDIPGLTVVIHTISVASKVSNIQSMGRLRNIKDKDLWFIYLYCKDLVSQVRLHKERESSLRPISKSYRYEHYQVPVRVR